MPFLKLENDRHDRWSKKKLPRKLRHVYFVANCASELHGNYKCLAEIWVQDIKSSLKSIILVDFLNV